MKREVKVVVVDDSSFECLVWQRLLTRRYGDAAAVHVFEDAEAAVAALGPDVDLLIVDWEMPGMEGADVAAAAVERGIDLGRVAFLSGHPREHLSARLDGAACAGLFDKNDPSSREELLALLDRIVKRAR